MLRTRNLTLNYTAQEITIDDSIDTANTISVQNTHATEIAYLGAASVTGDEYGIKLAPGDIWSADLGPNDQIFGFGYGTTLSVMILEK